MDKTIDAKMRELEERMSIASREGDLNRARSVTVGTAFGGATEVMMRGNNTYLWAVMQPVEVVELINQLAANVGCHVALQPKKDFASWREWRVTEEEKKHLNGHPPFVNDMMPFMRVGMEGLDLGLEKALVAGGKILEFNGGIGGNTVEGMSDGGAAGVPKEELIRRRNENVMATEKPEHRRSPKRAAKTS